MTKESVAIYDNPDGKCVVDVVAVPDWNGYDKICDFLKQEYEASVISSADGPDSRKSVLDIRGARISIQHDDPYGNSIEAETVESNDIVRAIGMDLKNRLGS